MNNLFYFCVLLHWKSQLSLASYPYYYQHSNLFQPNYEFESLGFVNPYYHASPPFDAQYPQLNTDQAYQIIYLQPAPQYNVIPPQMNYLEERNDQENEAPLTRNSTEEEMNYITDVHRENIMPTIVKSITESNEGQNEQYHGFTYLTQYEGGGQSNVVFYSGKGSHKIMFPFTKREDKSFGNATLTARTVASDSLDVNSSQEKYPLEYQGTPEFTSKNPLSSTSSSEKPSTTTKSKTTSTDAVEDFSAEQITSLNTLSNEEKTNFTQINLTTEETTETEDTTTENSLNMTSTLNSIK